MFQELQERLAGVFRAMQGGGRLSAESLEQALREIRRALLAADVEVSVARDFVARVKERALAPDSQVLRSLTPQQHVVKIVHDELVQLLGGHLEPLALGGTPPATILVMGLQGSGKTTFCAKLALQLKGKGRRPMLVACDLQRPAAIDQLEVLAAQAQVPCHAERSEPGKGDVVAVAQNALAAARARLCDVLIVDTAGRLQIDEPLMGELARLTTALRPAEKLLVLDAMTGQEAVSIARTFDQRIGITGSVLTKLDGDARGGAALSLVQVTGKPIKLVGVGEKIADLDAFHPDRMAGRILGMGDMMSLIEKAQEGIDEEQAQKLERKLRRAEFTFEDMLEQLQQVRKMGPLKQVLGLLPGMNAKALKGAAIDERQLDRVTAIIRSMTKDERRRPEILNGSRRKRIARGSGTDVADVNRVLKQYRDMKKMMRALKKAGSIDRLGKGFLAGM
jgi:signal recognition particle subunit SRP54